MNEELKTKEYLKSIKSIKLADSSRKRIKDNLLEYARFHNVPAGEVLVNTKIPARNPFLSWMSKPAPVALALVLLVGTTTSLLASEAAPGDFLYALKTNVNENLRSVFAIGTKSSVESPTELPPEQLAQATTTQSEETTSTVALAEKEKSHINIKPEGTFAINARTKVLLESAADDSLSSSDLVTMLSQGTISVGSYTSEINRRDQALRDLVTKYDAKIDSKVKTEFKKKLDLAATLTSEAPGKSEAEARVNLDKASVLIGEVEAELSTLGRAIVEDGVIIDIDFNVDVSVPESEEEAVVEGALDASSSLGL